MDGLAMREREAADCLTLRVTPLTPTLSPWERESRRSR
jgi:hypothetical protein